MEIGTGICGPTGNRGPLCLPRPSYTGVSLHTLETVYTVEVPTVGPASPNCTLLFLLVFLSCWVPVKVVESPI